jgi:ferredoxin
MPGDKCDGCGACDGIWPPGAIQDAAMKPRSLSGRGFGT